MSCPICIVFPQLSFISSRHQLRDKKQVPFCIRTNIRHHCQNLVTQATWCPEFLQSCLMWLSQNNASSLFQKGQEGREKFGFQVRRLNPNSSKTNREKRKTKNYMMLKHKARGKLKRSFKEKQVQGNSVTILLSTGALFSSYTYHIFTWLYVEIVSTLITIKNLGLS